MFVACIEANLTQVVIFILKIREETRFKKANQVYEGSPRNSHCKIKIK